MSPVRHGMRAGGSLVHVRPRFVRAEPSDPRSARPRSRGRPDGHRLPLLASLAPLVLSGALALAMRSPIMLLFALMSPVILLGQWWSDQRHGRLSHRRMLVNTRRLLEVDARRTSGCPRLGGNRLPPHRASRPLRWSSSSSSNEVPRLWERRPADDDWFVLRLGTATQPSRIVRTGAPTGEHPWRQRCPPSSTCDAARCSASSEPAAPALAFARSLMAQPAAWHSPRRTCESCSSRRADVPAATGNRRACCPTCSRCRRARSPAGKHFDPRQAFVVGWRKALVGDRESAGAFGGSRLGIDAGPPTDTLVVLDGGRELRAVPGIADLLRLARLMGWPSSAWRRTARPFPRDRGGR